MSTQDNLKAAFAGESQANQKYRAFAQKAEKDGQPQIARLFRAAAAAETIHAHSHLRTMGGLGQTAENLQTAIEGEGHEFKEMYPEFVEQAVVEGDQAAQRTFQYAMEVEKVHHELYQQALETLQGGGDLPQRNIYVCSVCGNTVYGQPDDDCPICGAKPAVFFEVD